MTQQDIALAAGVSEQTIRLFEAQTRCPYKETLERIRDAFERRGVEFLNGESPGVRLRTEKAIIE